jgi:hypothetical protein
MSLLYTIPVDCLVAVTTWRRFRRRYIRYLSVSLSPSPHISSLIYFRKNRVWEQDAFDLQAGGSFTQYRKGSDEVDERGSLLSEEKNGTNQLTHRQQRKSTNLIDEDDTVCVEMMRLGGCLALKENSFSQPPRNDSSFSQSRTLPSHDSVNKPPKGYGNVSTSTSLGTSATSLLSTFDPSRNSFQNVSPTDEHLPDSNHQPPIHQRSDLKVSFQDHDSALSRLSEYSDDLSSAKTVAWDRRTFQQQQQQQQSRHLDPAEQSYVDDQADDENSPPTELSEEVCSILCLASHLESSCRLGELVEVQLDRCMKLIVQFLSI